MELGKGMSPSVEYTAILLVQLSRMRMGSSFPTALSFRLVLVALGRFLFVRVVFRVVFNMGVLRLRLGVSISWRLCGHKKFLRFSARPECSASIKTMPSLLTAVLKTCLFKTGFNSIMLAESSM